MKEIRITKRDVKFFLLGIFTWLIIVAIWDWKGVKSDLIEGYKAGFSDSKK
ncbi:hypothetical protein [Pedobacter cryophilus]|uniref:hypothetical protein n=1 Tax=Pedobacter cryophilus TaxID=2571271 RepID=UPI00145CCA04|nr:hypothetical protein [Pedobacter cryophilus]